MVYILDKPITKRQRAYHIIRHRGSIALFAAMYGQADMDIPARIMLTEAYIYDKDKNIGIKLDNFNYHLRSKRVISQRRK